MNPLSETQKAYIAGIIDGEGCISIGKSYKSIGVSAYHSLVILVVNCDRGLIDYMVDTVGEGHVYVQQGRKANHRPLHQWIIGQREAQRFLKEVRDYLVIKRDQADVALNFMKTFDGIVPSGGYRTPKSVLRQRDEYEVLLKQLKKESTVLDTESTDDRLELINQMHTQHQLSLF